MIRVFTNPNELDSNSDYCKLIVRSRPWRKKGATVENNFGKQTFSCFGLVGIGFGLKIGRFS